MLDTVGAAGSILTEWWGDLPAWKVDLDTEVEMDPFELVDDALLWLWW